MYLFDITRRRSKDHFHMDHVVKMQECINANDTFIIISSKFTLFTSQFKVYFELMFFVYLLMCKHDVFQFIKTRGNGGTWREVLLKYDK